MCVWTAYAGKKHAASVVFENLKKTEGFWAGHYTGIASCHKGVFHLNKCCGHTGVFEQRFNVAEMPGNMAIAHSRTPSGGLDNRAQPHVGSHGLMALHSQGSAGVFAGPREGYTEVLMELYAQGCRPRSGGPAENGMREIPGMTDPDGRQVSSADIELNFIESNYKKHGDMIQALREAAVRLPGEHCSVCLFADKPGVIGFLNMNQRLCYAFEEDGVYMGTTMESLPGMGMEIPGDSVGYVTCDGTLHLERASGRKINTAIPDGLCQAAVEYLKANPRSQLAVVCDKAMRPLFNRGELDYHAIAFYRVFERLLDQGVICYEEEELLNQATQCRSRRFLWSVKQ
jgi:hypothetical protein